MGLTQALVGEDVDGVTTACHLGQDVLVMAVKLTRDLRAVRQIPEEVDAIVSSIDKIRHLDLQTRSLEAEHNHRCTGEGLPTVFREAIRD